ncbi:hypothetical protein [Nonomuraea dietziae]|uniref:hypothetical protein n=1 Tax=Nonomuraea dietziae TaxID=65515 RepID=UPI003406E455
MRQPQDRRTWREPTLPERLVAQAASGALESIQQLGASLGIAVLGTAFFGQMGGPAGPAAVQTSVQAGRHGDAEHRLTGLAFAVGFLLPRKAR